MKLNIKKEINIKRDRVFLSVAAIFISLYSAFSFTYFVNGAGSVKSDVVRLHILANSDSEIDQDIKLQVRDALLSQNTEILSEGVNKDNAHMYFAESKLRLLETANRVLRENGFSYDAKITLEEEYFETRQYGTLTFPAGEYLSLKVILGEGKGHNWWCVMFPPLCVPAADDVDVSEDTAKEFLSYAGGKVVNGGEKYAVKFKLLELYEELRNKMGV